MSALTDADQDAGLRDYVDRLRSWGENDPDPNYFTGDVLNCLLLDCGHASVAFATLRARATAAEDKLRDREAEIERLKRDLARQHASFDLRWKADMRAIKRWHAAGGDELTWPDHADLVVWLLTQWLGEPPALASTEHHASSEEATDVSGS